MIELRQQDIARDQLRRQRREELVGQAGHHHPSGVHQSTIDGLRHPLGSELPTARAGAPPLADICVALIFGRHLNPAQGADVYSLATPPRHAVPRPTVQHEGLASVVDRRARALQRPRN